MKLNGKITILKQVSSRENISSFQNGNISITTKQTPLTASNEDVEGYDVKAIITIRVRNEKKDLDMSGYCGV